MTGYTVHTGSSDDFARGWDRIFGGTTHQKSAAPKPKASAARKTTAKGAAKGKGRR